MCIYQVKFTNVDKVMINFNELPYIGKELEYVKIAIENKKICGDGQFTKLCNAWIEEKTGTSKALLTTSCTSALEMAAMLCDIRPGDEKLSCRHLLLFLRLMLLC